MAKQILFKANTILFVLVLILHAARVIYSSKMDLLDYIPMWASIVAVVGIGFFAYANYKEIKK